MAARTQFKTNVVERYRNGESSRQIGKEERCSYNTVLRELKRRGIYTGKLWTKEEIEKLKKLYLTASNAELLEEFPNRKKEAILGMASELGIKKRKYKEICQECRKEFIVKGRHGRKLCLKCVKKRIAHNDRKGAIARQRRWLQKNPGYLEQYVRRPEVKKRMYRYQKWLRKESPKYRLDQNMCAVIRQSLKGKKAGRGWKTLIDYTLKDLMEHLEGQFDESMTWENYGSYWHVDHIRPRSLFQYTSWDEPEFKKCWALENLQPLERIANLRKGNRCNIKSNLMS